MRALQQRRQCQQLRRRRHPQTQAAGLPEGGQEAHAPVRQGRHPAGSVHCRAEDGRGLGGETKMPRRQSDRSHPSVSTKMAPLELMFVEPSPSDSEQPYDIAAIAPAAAQRWASTLETIGDEFRRGDPLQVLLNSAMYLVASLSPRRGLGEQVPFQQHEAELLQAHALRVRLSDARGTARPAEVTHNILEAIKENQQAFAFKSLSPLPQTEWKLWELLERVTAAFNLIPREIQRFHYLRRRGEIEERLEYDADERDLLALYIDGGFNLGKLELGDVPLQLYGASETLWALADATGRMRRPTFKFTRLWMTLLDGIEEIKPPGWTEIAYTVLLATLEEQSVVSSEFDKASREVANLSDSRGFGLVVGPPQERRALAICVERNVPQRQLREHMRKYVAEAAQMASRPIGVWH